MTQIFAERKSEWGELAVTCTMAFVQARARGEISSHLHLRSSAKSAVSHRAAFTEGGTR